MECSKEEAAELVKKVKPAQLRLDLRNLEALKETVVGAGVCPSRALQNAIAETKRKVSSLNEQVSNFRSDIGSSI